VFGIRNTAIILPESSLQDAAIRADGLRSEVKRLRLEYKNQLLLGTITLSAGVARIAGARLDLRRTAQSRGPMSV
jgi:PleD family two-component response regulator